MKTEQLLDESLDDITFDKRNKEYGAYYLRKSYHRNVVTALIISISFAILIVALPLIVMYLHKDRILYNYSGVGTELMGIKEITVEITSTPEPPNQITGKFLNQVPVVVNDTLIQGTTFTGIGLNDQENNVNNENKEAVFDKTGKQVLGGGFGEGVFGYNVVTIKPYFPGGDEGMSKFIKEYIKYPDLAIDYGIQGTVYISVIVESDGRLSNFKIVKGIGAGCDEEAERVLKLMPNWIPGKQNSRPVRVQVLIPIKFIVIQLNTKKKI
jgi:periplasmic protein TonB